MYCSCSVILCGAVAACVDVAGPLQRPASKWIRFRWRTPTLCRRARSQYLTCATYNLISSLRAFAVLALMPTGGRKSVCFQLPALCHQGTTIVVLPLLSLMRNRLMALQQKGVQAMVWNSESSNASKPGLLRSANACELVYTTLEQFESEDLRCWK